MDPNNTGGDPTQDNVNHPRAYAFSGKIVLSTIVVLFTVVLLILFLHLYVRWHVFRRHTRRRRLIFTAEDQRPSSSAPRGLDPEVLNSLPVLVYSAKESGDDVAECAVCLSEFQEGEKVRCLPRCNHRFHIECIDMWFSSHHTCPLYRSAVEVESAAPDAADSLAPVAEESSPPLPPHLHADLCFMCRMEEGDNLIGSSSSGSASWELSIELPRRGEGLRSLEEELVLESTSGHGVKSSGIRILSIKRFLNRDQRLIRDGGSEGETDLERGEGAERVSPPSAPPRPLPSSAE